MTLAGKLALITGAASGVGLSTARLFAEQESDLILVDISEKIIEITSELTDNFPLCKITSYVVDITDGKQVEDLFENIKKMYKRVVTLVVNSAGIARGCKIINMTEEDFDQMISVNLKGTFLVTKSAIRSLVNAYPEKEFTNKTEPYASIINLSSQAAINGLPNTCHYSASKSGIIGLTKSLAAEYGSFRIRVNAVLPYFLETPCHDLHNHPEQKEFFIKRVPFGRFGEPDEVANLNLFLASDHSSYISGACIDVTGGL